MSVIGFQDYPKGTPEPSCKKTSINIDLIGANIINGLDLLIAFHNSNNNVNVRRM